MQAMGFIETKGLLSAVEAADVMLKTANVKLFQKSYASGGLVCITVVGDVGAVKAAVEAGKEAVQRLGSHLCVSAHMIPRPLAEVFDLLGEVTLAESDEEQVSPLVQEETKEESLKRDVSIEIQDKVQADAFVESMGLEAFENELEKLTVVKLRTLARQYSDLRIAGRRISKADKKMLMDELKVYYSK